jgi:hypothetical protein
MLEGCGMQHGTETAEKHRERAKQIRKISLDVRGDDNRKYLLNLAREYDQMAKEVGSS